MPKILIIEDDNILAKAIKIKLSEAGFDVLISYDGEDALVKAESFSPDVIILDLLLPKKSGEDVLAELKASPKTKAIPVFVCSVKSDPATIKKCQELGIEGYFIKSSYTLEGIVQKVQKFLNK